MNEVFYYNSLIGILEIVVENDYLVSLRIQGNKEVLPQSKIAKQIKLQLDEYFSNGRKKFNIKTKFNGTDFQNKVWRELSNIPYGTTKSYKEIAELIENPNAIRAVGGACNKNPIMIIIPCHRVVAKNGDLTGFACGIDIKEKLLKLEKSLGSTSLPGHTMVRWYRQGNN